MLYFKSCPKCRGDVYKDKDAYGSFLQCLQCGLLRDIEEEGKRRFLRPAAASPGFGHVADAQEPAAIAADGRGA